MVVKKPMSSSSIVIILTVFCLTLFGMCFSCIYNCVRKLKADHQDYQVNPSINHTIMSKMRDDKSLQFHLTQTRLDRHWWVEVELILFYLTLSNLSEFKKHTIGTAVISYLIWTPANCDCDIWPIIRYRIIFSFRLTIWCCIDEEITIPRGPPRCPGRNPTAAFRASEAAAEQERRR